MSKVFSQYGISCEGSKEGGVSAWGRTSWVWLGWLEWGGAAFGLWAKEPLPGVTRPLDVEGTSGWGTVPAFLPRPSPGGPLQPCPAANQKICPPTNARLHSRLSKGQLKGCQPGAAQTLQGRREAE